MLSCIFHRIATSLIFKVVEEYLMPWMFREVKCREVENVRLKCNAIVIYLRVVFSYTLGMDKLSNLW